MKHIRRAWLGVASVVTRAVQCGQHGSGFLPIGLVQNLTLLLTCVVVECEQKAKDMLMRVGFEPTPFRTSDCDVPEGNTLS
jgi:hypothetical protein